MKMLKIFDKIDEMESQRVISSILSNIFNIFVNLYPTLIAFFRKTSAIAVATLSVAMVTTDAFQKRLNYDAKEIIQNRENICGNKTHQKPGGHILSQKNQTAISHAMKRS